MTEAVAGEKEVQAHTTVDWHFRATGEEELHYDHPHPNTLHEDFNDRLEWQGTMRSKDVQIGAVFIHNVTFNDTGTYHCTFHPRSYLPLDNEYITGEKEVDTHDLCIALPSPLPIQSVVSEIMMYVLIMIWAEHEAWDARKTLRAQELALINEPLDSKDNCDGVLLE
uniref:Si:ch211-225p5.8 n=1 Tax=Oncorhynchus kisutch TaxID=8019 RepID=A0A8C7MZ06_ONCKI